MSVLFYLEDEQWLTLVEVAPRWSKIIESMNSWREFSTKYKAVFKDGLNESTKELDIQDYRCCLVGEFRCFDSAYTNFNRDEVCEMCIRTSVSFGAFADLVKDRQNNPGDDPLANALFASLLKTFLQHINETHSELITQKKIEYAPLTSSVLHNDDRITLEVIPN